MTKRSVDPRALDFCEEMLPLVSRTFAINIRVLSEELYDAVLCAYLLCRIVDTVEDSESLSSDQQVTLLRAFTGFFPGQKRQRAHFDDWVAGCGRLDQTRPESRLIAGCRNVFRLYEGLSPENQTAVADCVVEMAGGMAEFIEKKARDGGHPYCFETVAELERYCYYVAGTVGIMLTRLFIARCSTLGEMRAAKLRELQLSFALGLQLTNIVKDCRGDRARGWCYVPLELGGGNAQVAVAKQGAWPEKVSLRALNALTQKAAIHLDDALAYALLFPRRQVRIRLFNLWSLLLAIRTLGAAYDNRDLVTSDRRVKISRRVVYWTLLQSTLLVFSNSLLERLYRGLRRTVPSTSENSQ